MRDDHYRRLCDSPDSYDRAIDLIKIVNPYCAMKHTPEEREVFAVESVHSCISGVLFGKSGHFYSTGGAMATRLSSDPHLPGYGKVVLSVKV